MKSRSLEGAVLCHCTHLARSCGLSLCVMHHYYQAHYNCMNSIAQKPPNGNSGHNCSSKCLPCTEIQAVLPNPAPMQAALKHRYAFSGLAAAAAVLFRQTNAVWAVFVLMVWLHATHSPLC